MLQNRKSYNFVIFLEDDATNYKFIAFSNDCYELEYLQKCMSRTSSNCQSRNAPSHRNNFKAPHTTETFPTPPPSPPKKKN